jgi:hypothetical protein
VNIVGHVEVARRVAPGEDAGFLEGTAAPDFATMLGLRLGPVDGHRSPEARGVRVHHRTDDAFHDTEAFRTQCAALRADLHRAGLPRGAARACGHVGVELLLDGALLAEQATVDAAESVLASLATPGPGLLALAAPPDKGHWEHGLGQIGERLTLSGYGSPDTVAERLHRVVQGRPRLAFDRSQVPRLAEALARARPAVVAGAAGLVAEVTGSVATSVAR